MTHDLFAIARAGPDSSELGLANEAAALAISIDG